jgi:RNA polymerase sigma factor for flagellar operon FliA
MKTLPEVNIKKVWDHYFQHRDIDSRNTLLEYYLPQVKYTAERLHRCYPKCVELEDLQSAGIFGLLDAIEKFDPTENVKFETYSVLRIQGAIRDDIRKKDWVPRLVRARAQALQALTQRLEALFGRSPTETELAEELKMDMDQFYEFQRDANANSLISLNTNFSESDKAQEFSGLDLIANLKSQNPFTEIYKRDFREYIKKGFSRPEQMILVLYYFEQMTMKEISVTLGISESRVCQVHTSIIARLKGRAKLPFMCSA